MIPGEITEDGKSKLPPALQGPGQGRIIGKFQMAAHGDAIGQPGHLDLKGLKSRAIYMAVASPSVSGLVAMMTSSTPP